MNLSSNQKSTLDDAEIASKEDSDSISLNEFEADLVAEAAALAESYAAIKTRCESSGIVFEERGRDRGESSIRIGFKNGRETRWLAVSGVQRAKRVLSVEFEKYVFISNLTAICSYKDNLIEALVQSVNPIGTYTVYRPLFDSDALRREGDSEQKRIVLEAPGPGLPAIELGVVSSDMKAMLGPRYSGMPLTLKLSGLEIKDHDQALAVLIKLANSVLFQVELITNVALTIERQRPYGQARNSVRSNSNLIADLRNDVADRIYDIRCKIVHTKAGVDDSSFELLLPFSKDAEQLHHDIELIRFIARSVLVAASVAINLEAPILNKQFTKS